VGVLLTVLSWSANFVIVKAAIGVMGPLTFTAGRYLIATVTLFLLVRWRHGTIAWPGTIAWQLVGLGMLGFGCYQVLWTVGLTQITAGDSALIVAASPVLVALLAGAFGMDRLTRPKLAGALVAFSGVAIVIAGGQALLLGSNLAGDGLTLAAAAMWAVYTVSATRVLRHIDPLRATAFAVLGGFLVLLPAGTWDLLTAPPTSVPATAFLGMAYSGIIAAGIANVLVFNAIRLVGPTRASAMQLLVPAGAVALGAIVLAEPVGTWQVVGGAIIVLGVSLTRRAGVAPAAIRARTRAVG
jgi:drug/metabolite transporter (DMT)-like permease